MEVIYNIVTLIIIIIKLAVKLPGTTFVGISDPSKKQYTRK